MTPEQFWSKVNRNGPYSKRMKSECWEWNGLRAPKTWGLDYGIVYWAGRNRNAHRVAWELTHGVVIPRHLLACHSCDNPPCVRPDHIWIGTSQQNAIDRVLKGRSGRVHDWGPLHNGRMDYAPKRAA